MATHNGSRYLPAQLESISRQTHTNWKLLAGDDGSTDDTVAILESFALQHPGRVQIAVGEPVHSPRDNFFRLLSRAPSAAYFAFCDQDDVWLPTKLERLVSACAASKARNPHRPQLVHSDLEVVDRELRPIAPSFMASIRSNPGRTTFGSSVFENSVPGCAMLVDGHFIELFRNHAETWQNAIMHDWWFVLIARALGDVTFVNETLVLYRQHDGNTLGSVRRSGIAFVGTKLFRPRLNTGPNTYDQAMAFYTAFGPALGSDTKRQLEAYRDFPRSNKLRRIVQCVKHGLLKETFPRRIYQMIRI